MSFIAFRGVRYGVKVACCRAALLVILNQSLVIFAIYIGTPRRENEFQHMKKGIGQIGIGIDREV
jgi:hypothetical protein